MSIRVELGDGQVLLAASGERLVDLLDEARVGAPFSCRSANCGVCAVEVTGDTRTLAAPSADELRITQSNPGMRLACQIRFEGDDGELRIRFLSGDWGERGH